VLRTSVKHSCSTKISEPRGSPSLLWRSSLIWANTWMKEKFMLENHHHKRLVVKFRANSAAYIPHIDHVEKHLIQKQICNWSEVEGVAKKATLNPLIGKIGICDKLRSVAEKLKLVQSREKRG